MILELEEVTMRFAGVTAVRDVSFGVKKGEILGLMGANGAGKTTLFNIIGGSLHPTGGRVRLEGRRIEKLRPWQISRAGVARTYQIVRPFPAFAVWENVALSIAYGMNCERSMQRAAARAHEIAEETGLGAFAHTEARNLTLAGRKRLEIARALGAAPKILLLDEVLAGLNPTEVESALVLLAELHKRYDLTIIMVEHVLQGMMQLCSRVVVLHHGEKIAEGDPNSVAGNQRVIDAYLGGNSLASA